MYDRKKNCLSKVVAVDTRAGGEGLQKVTSYTVVLKTRTSFAACASFVPSMHAPRSHKSLGCNIPVAIKMKHACRPHSQKRVGHVSDVHPFVLAKS